MLGCIFEEVKSWIEEDDEYEITDKEIVALVNSDGDKMDNQAATVEPLRIRYNDGVKDL